ncbi:hypothetical protein [Thermincola potens]|uniref:hypothetical protein n=1 Tax=Thermincola potens TaxID=863643 RepID=UPI0012FD82B7|nr:hypothetical protein [Thermincola potens]
MKLLKSSALEILHDQIMNRLDTPEKAGIKSLLAKNNRLLKKVFYNYMSEHKTGNVKDIMVALDNLLDIHARECYTIGYLDGIGHKRSEIKLKT